MKGKYILDGFPRSDENVKVWNEIMGHLVDFKFLLFFKCSFEVMEKRILGRGEGRIDDNPETIKKRFDTFTNETMPIVEYFRQ
jgi:UMP-CMP kinase